MRKMTTQFICFSTVACLLFGASTIDGMSPAVQGFEGYSVFRETMADMTWPEVEQAAHDGAVILLPTAVIEEHGPHMGNGVDTYLAYQTCLLARRELEERGIKALIAPPFYWGRNGTTHVFPGTFTVRATTMKALLHDLLDSLRSWGFSEVFNVNWHYDGTHLSTLLQSVISARKDLDIDVKFMIPDYDVERFRFSGEEPFILVHKTPETEEVPQDYVDLHAGAGETGIMAAHFPEQVDLELTKRLEKTRLTMQDAGAWVKDARKVTPLGYFGNPAGYDIEESLAFHTVYSTNIAAAIAAYLIEKGYATSGSAKVEFAAQSYSIFADTMVDMTWQEVEQAAREDAVVLLNTAVIEEHGPHMVCGIDSYIGALWCRLTRQKLEEMGVRAVIAPPFYWGINRSTHVFPGTFTVRDQTLKDVLHDTLASLKSWGFTRIFTINTHGDGEHIGIIIQSLRDARSEMGIETSFLFSEERAKRASISGKEPHILIFKSPALEKSPPKYMDVHAGWLETGIIAASMPGLVDVELARTLKPTRLDWSQAGKWLRHTREVTPLGYLGDPASHDKEAARAYVEELTANMAAAIAKEIRSR